MPNNPDEGEEEGFNSVDVSATWALDPRSGRYEPMLLASAPAAAQARAKAGARHGEEARQEDIVQVQEQVVDPIWI